MTSGAVGCGSPWLIYNFTYNFKLQSSHHVFLAAAVSNGPTGEPSSPGSSPAVSTETVERKEITDLLLLYVTQDPTARHVRQSKEVRLCVRLASGVLETFGLQSTHNLRELADLRLLARFCR
jgi:hypothetical protein